MQQGISRHMPRDMAVLGVVEAALSFVVVYTMTQQVGALPWPPGAANGLNPDSFAIAIILTLIAVSIGLTFGLYRPEAFLNRKRLLVSTLLGAAVFGVLALAVGGAMPTDLAVPRASAMMKALGAWLAAMALTRLVYGFCVVRRSPTRRIVFLGERDRVAAAEEYLRSGRGRGFDAVTLSAPTVSWTALHQQRVGTVVLTSAPDATTMESLLDCKLRGTRILDVASFLEKYHGRIDLDGSSAGRLLVDRGFRSGGGVATLKRAVDIVVGLTMLALTLPLMAVTALAIKIDSPGPVLYRQQRVGQFGKSFSMLKFRSMIMNAEPAGSPLWAQERDRRITRVGRFIRAARIDELPQLVNVLGGEMSLVGPRPERPHFVEQLAAAIPFYRQRSYVKPGLTGWAQVNFPYGASVEDARQKLSYDLYYVQHRTILLDLAILCATVRVVLLREGAR